MGSDVSVPPIEWLLTQRWAVKYWKFVPDHRLQGSESAQAKIYSSQGCITRSVRDMALKPFCLSLAQIPQECAFVSSCQCVTVSVWVCAYQGMMCIHYWKCSLCLKRIHTGSLHHHNTPSPAKLGSAEMLRKKRRKTTSKNRDSGRKKKWLKEDSRSSALVSSRRVELLNLCLADLEIFCQLSIRLW